MLQRRIHTSARLSVALSDTEDVAASSISRGRDLDQCCDFGRRLFLRYVRLEVGSANLVGVLRRSCAHGRSSVDGRVSKKEIGSMVLLTQRWISPPARSFLVRDQLCMLSSRWSQFIVYIQPADYAGSFAGCCRIFGHREMVVTVMCASLL